MLFRNMVNPVNRNRILFFLYRSTLSFRLLEPSAHRCQKIFSRRLIFKFKILNLLPFFIYQLDLIFRFLSIYWYLRLILSFIYEQNTVHFNLHLTRVVEVMVSQLVSFFNMGL